MQANQLLLSFLRRVLPAMCLCWLTINSARAATTNYYTGFESTEGYVAWQPLVSQGGWTGIVVSTNSNTNSASSDGNGVFSSGFPGSGQAAYVGLTPLSAPYNNYIEVNRNLGLDPIGSGQPEVTFSAKVQIWYSAYTSPGYDAFFWNFYNSDGHPMFKIELDTDSLGIYYWNSTNGITQLGEISSDGISSDEYVLSVAMNFASNRCSVFLSGATLTNNIDLVMALSGVVLDLDSVGAVWSPSIKDAPGDNYMLFDDCLVVSSGSAAPTPSAPQLEILMAGGSSPATVRLTGENGFTFALDASTDLASWTAVDTNDVSGGIADYTDPGATNQSARYYRARWVP